MPAKFLTAEWRTLAMLNYEVDPAILRPLVPAGTELDLYAGSSLVSVVGFMFLKTKVLGLPIPFHRNFEELNLRFYVRRRHPDGDRRGVVFIKELVPRWCVAAVARWAYNENYVALPMRHEIRPAPEDAARPANVEYAWRHADRWSLVRVETAGPAQDAAAGSEEEFVTEHYWGYARQRNGDTMEYEVQHPRWKIWPTRTAELDADVAALYGAQFVAGLSTPPRSAFLAEGSAVAVFSGAKLPANHHASLARYRREIRMRPMDAKPAKLVLQAGAVPFRRIEDRVEYCLVTSLRTGRWGFPKGMIDPGETAIETALKEAQEEAGLLGQIIGEPLGHFDYSKWGLRLRAEMHLMSVRQVEADYLEAAARKRRWASLEEARELLDRDFLRRILDLAAERVVAQG